MTSSGNCPLFTILICTRVAQRHNYLGISERYHDPFRKTLIKLREDNPNLKKYFLLAIATRTVNDALGPEGIVPSA